MHAILFCESSEPPQKGARPFPEAEGSESFSFFAALGEDGELCEISIMEELDESTDESGVPFSISTISFSITSLLSTSSYHFKSYHSKYLSHHQESQDVMKIENCHY